MKIKPLLWFFLIGCTLPGTWSHAASLGTAFTYQGRLADAGQPATGLFDLRLTLFDALAAGNAVGGPLNLASVGITNGVFTVTLDFANGAFNGEARWLEIAVHATGSAEAYTTLAPRQALTATPYAQYAPSAGAAALANSVPAGSITSSSLAAGAAAANLQASGQGAVPQGGMILSGSATDSSLLGAGYVKSEKITLGGLWEPRSGVAAPSVRDRHTAVWTGTEMIIWGGDYYDGNSTTYPTDGGRYKPVGNTWSATSLVGVPAGRTLHTAVWTGTEMIIWGGSVNTGGRYNPVANTWSNVTTVGAPSARILHTAVWTGTEMIIWGGNNGSTFFNDGARYNPASNTWTTIASTGAPGRRQQHSAVWTGSEMIVWGGISNSTYYVDGARYNPISNSWSSLSVSGAPIGRAGQSAVWTGTEMIVWGGNRGNTYYNLGGRYHAESNIWTSVTTAEAPSVRSGHSAVWTGAEMIVWGGVNSTPAFLNDGSRYNPLFNSWTVMNPTGAPIGRSAHTALWTGSEMLTYGGSQSTIFYVLNDTFSYAAPRTFYLYLKP